MACGQGPHQPEQAYEQQDCQLQAAGRPGAVRISVGTGPRRGRALAGLAFASLIGGETEQALGWAQKTLQELPNLTVGHRAQILALTRLNRMDEARETGQRMVTLDPGFTIATRMPPYRDARFREELYGALRAVGLPD